MKKYIRILFLEKIKQILQNYFLIKWQLYTYIYKLCAKTKMNAAYIFMPNHPAASTQGTEGQGRQ